jgi:hypothetical protein
LLVPSCEAGADSALWGPSEKEIALELRCAATMTLVTCAPGGKLEL